MNNGANRAQLALFESPSGRVPFKPVAQPDICRNRHGGNAQSTLANQRGDHALSREAVYRLIAGAGEGGLTLDEAAVMLDVAPNRISGRVTQLKASGQIRDTGLRRLTRTGSLAAVYQSLK